VRYILEIPNIGLFFHRIMVVVTCTYARVMFVVAAGPCTLPLDRSLGSGE
jgi:hypothetical protein